MPQHDNVIELRPQRATDDELLECQAGLLACFAGLHARATAIIAGLEESQEMVAALGPEADSNRAGGILDEVIARLDKLRASALCFAEGACDLAGEI